MVEISQLSILRFVTVRAHPAQRHGLPEPQNDISQSRRLVTSRQESNKYLSPYASEELLDIHESLLDSISGTLLFSINEDGETPLGDDPRTKRKIN